MNEIDLDRLLQLRPYLFIKHHVTGRIRIAFSVGLLDKVPRGESGRLQALMSRLPGVRDVRLNLPARSAVVTYDPRQIAPQVLVDLLEGDESAAVEAMRTLISGFSAAQNAK